MPVNQSEAPWPALRRASRTVVVVDVVESVRLMEQDEDDTIRRWQSFVGEVVTRLLPQHGGRLVKSLGDGLMLEFESVPPAVQCALAMQQAIQPYNQGLPGERWMCLRVGAHVADVVVDERDIYGAGVNLAARLATLAGPGEVVVSAEVRDGLVAGLDADVEDLGMCFLKHLAQPVRGYRLRAISSDGPVELPIIGSVGDLRPTLAVLPFAELGAGAEASAMGELLADEATAALSRSIDIHVISRLSAWVYAQRRLGLEQAPSVLGADFVLSGNCHSEAGRIRVYVELADAVSGRIVWSDRYLLVRDRVLIHRDDLLDGLVPGVCAAMAAQALKRSATYPWPQLRAYELLLAAVALMHRLSPIDFQRARELLEALMERLPRQPLLHAWMAKWHVLRVQQGWAEQRADDGHLALDHSRRAIDLDDECSLAWAIDGFVQTNLFKKLDLAEQRYARALQVNPNEALAWSLKGAMHAFRGEGEAAMEGAERALKLSPLDPNRYFYLSLAATAALSAQRFDEAAQLARCSLRLNATHTSTLRALTIAQVQLGQGDAARQTMHTLRKLEPDLTVHRYLQRTPSSEFPTGRLWATSLQQAGLPSG